MNKTAIIVISIVLLGIAGLFTFQSQAAPKLVVYKNAACGCCGDWIEHMKASGYTVEVHDVEDLNSIKAQHSVTGNLASCHTAIIDGYVIEGHVPAEDVTRMLAERPAILGLAVPGMPIGAPGMEQGSPADYQAYNVVTFDGSGSTSVYRSVAGGAGSRP